MCCMIQGLFFLETISILNMLKELCHHIDQPVDWLIIYILRNYVHGNNSFLLGMIIYVFEKNSQPSICHNISFKGVYL